MSTAKKTNNEVPAQRAKYSHGSSRAFVQAGNQRPHECHVYDVSTTGIAILVQFNQRPRIGESVTIEFDEPGFGRISGSGLVVRIEFPTHRSDWKIDLSVLKIGIRFTKLSDACRSFIAAKSQKKRSWFLRKYYRAHISKYVKKNPEIFYASGLALILIIIVTALLSQSSDTQRKENSKWSSEFWSKAPRYNR